MPVSQIFRPCGFKNLPGWLKDDHRDAFAAFRRSAGRGSSKPYRTGSLGVDSGAFDEAFLDARQIGEPDAQEAREFFETHFAPCRIEAPESAGGFVTGYYEPFALASSVKTEKFSFPVFRPPDDLIKVDDSNRPEGFDPDFRFGRMTETGVCEYFDRREIEQGALDGRDLEIAWLADPVDLFFIHVQGAARLQFPGGAEKRITYAAKSGHRFTGPGGVLARLGEIDGDNVTMQTIRAWFAANTGRINEILWQNRSFIFFREAPVDDPALGPVAAAKVPLTPGRSIAVDRLLHTFATPFFVHAPRLDAFDGNPFSRLMIAQDTGSAIVGAARGDLFAGCGPRAGDIAGVIRHDAEFFALLPRGLLSGRA